MPSNNLGPHLDERKWRLTRDFYASTDPKKAMRILEELSVRYLVTSYPVTGKITFADRIHLRHDSRIRETPSTGRLRLVAVSDLTALKVAAADGANQSARVIWYKLFEVVDGAQLIVKAPPGEPVWAEIRLEIPSSRPAVYQTAGIAGRDGIARIRVPYSTRQRGMVATPGLWRVRVGEDVRRYEVSEADVREGREVHAVLGELPEAS